MKAKTIRTLKVFGVEIVEEEKPENSEEVDA